MTSSRRQAMTMVAQSFPIDDHRRASSDDTGTVVLAVSGDVDLATAGRLAAELERQTVPGRDRIVVDCREITFIDSVGIRTLIEAMLNATKLGASFRLRGLPAPLARVLDLAGVTDLFTIDDDPTRASVTDAARDG